MKRRKAFSVIEVLMVVSIGTFLLALVTMLMIRTLDSHRVIQGHLRNTFVHRDLNTVFHEDVHAAGHVSIEDSQLSIRIADQSITYTASKDGVERIEKRDGNIIREDSYYFSKFHSIEFEKSEKFGKAFLIFAVKKQANQAAPELTVLQMVAQIGKHKLP